LQTGPANLRKKEYLRKWKTPPLSLSAVSLDTSILKFLEFNFYRQEIALLHGDDDGLEDLEDLVAVIAGEIGSIDGLLRSLWRVAKAGNLIAIAGIIIW
jgi:hypothetical protein